MGIQKFIQIFKKLFKHLIYKYTYFLEFFFNSLEKHWFVYHKTWSFLKQIEFSKPRFTLLSTKYEINNKKIFINTYYIYNIFWNFFFEIYDFFTNLEQKWLTKIY